MPPGRAPRPRNDGCAPASAQAILQAPATTRRASREEALMSRSWRRTKLLRLPIRCGRLVAPPAHVEHVVQRMRLHMAVEGGHDGLLGISEVQVAVRGGVLGWVVGARRRGPANE